MAASFAKIPHSIFPPKKESRHIPTPKTNETATADFSALTARSGFPAPMFCATNAEMDCMNAAGTSIIKPHTFSATPTPAEAVTPKAFTTA